MGHLQRTAQSGSGCLEDWCEVFGCENGEKSWVHLTRKYLQIEFPMTRHHNQCFVKLSQLTDNKQEPTHDHKIQSSYNANSTLPLYDALILSLMHGLAATLTLDPAIES